MADDQETPVESPTYLEHIRRFFNEHDIECMRGMGIDLATYEGVKFNALRIYFRTEDGTMPMGDADRKWSPARLRTFYNWMKLDFPRGIAEPVKDPKAPAGAERVRRNLADMDPGGQDMETLKTAFRGVMDRDPDDPQSYFSLAGIHWLPGPDYYCRHHENGYNPWHRLYLMAFEDALRSVEGCEDVTLPYWDIGAEDVPGVLYDEPFADYVIPRELCTLENDCYPAGHRTQRYEAAAIVQNIQDYGIADNIAEALAQSHWERFNGWDAGRTQEGIIRAHDSGHNACGVTLRNQDIAAFDPLFWFFHANWDRLWWKWQQDFRATTLDTFKNFLSGSANWLDDPVLNRLPPFEKRTPQTINLADLGVDYEHPRETPPATVAQPQFGSLAAAAKFAVPETQKVSVRVKNINRLDIPGSFDVLLRAGGETIGRQAFFQATSPKHCETCRKNEWVSMDFVVDQDLIRGRSLDVGIELNGRRGGSRPFPLSACGNPTVNIRLLMAA